VNWLSWEHPVHVLACVLAAVGGVALVAAGLLDSRA
jgi:hypothetical protein